MKSYTLTSLAILCLSTILCRAQENITIQSPNGKIKVTVSIAQTGIPHYEVACSDSVILKASKLGIQLADNNLSDSLKIKSTGSAYSITSHYKLFSDKKSECTYKANVNSILFVNPKGELLEVTFGVSDDGVAFRYKLPGRSVEIKKIINESTSFHFPLTAKAWLHPHAAARSGWNACQPSYEENYEQEIGVGKESPFKAGWSFPALFKSCGCWVLISEADADRDYCGSRLSSSSPDGEYSVAFPQLPERTDSTAATYPQSTLPWISPWRVIIIGRTLAPIVESTLITDVSKPCKLSDTSFIKPGKSSWTWVLYKDDSTVYSTQKRFINYASAMKWDYCLIDAFWDTKIGYEKIKELVDYGNTKNVKILLWYNSAGNWNTTPLTPRDLMINPELRRKEFEKLHNMGVAGVKIDFFGGDGQSMIAYYIDLFEDAAKYKLMVNCHGATIPRGWTRTYPNLVSMEAVRGFEFVTFEQQNADMEPTHCTILPFTRNAIGPMDFTPVCFSEVPGMKRITTNAFELALSVLFQSGIQHYAEVPEGMMKQPDYVIEFIKNVPKCWDEIKFIDGYPGKFAVLARKGNGKWFVSGINGENNQKELEIDLSIFGSKGGTLITDGESNRLFSKSEISGNKIKLTIKPYGGFVITMN
jgi:alpha-glucosidase